MGGGEGMAGAWSRRRRVEFSLVAEGKKVWGRVFRCTLLTPKRVLSL